MCSHFQEIPETLRGAGEAPEPRCARRGGERLGGWAGTRSRSGPVDPDPLAPRDGRGSGRGPLEVLLSVIGFRAQCSALGRGLGYLDGPWQLPPFLQLSGQGHRAQAASLTFPHLGRPAKSRGPQRWCKVNFNYNPEQVDELKLQAGDIVEVIKEVRG